MFEKLGDTALRGVELGEKPTPFIERRLLERIASMDVMR